jgi:hypothetical protein
MQITDNSRAKTACKECADVTDTRNRNEWLVTYEFKSWVLLLEWIREVKGEVVGEKGPICTSNIYLWFMYANDKLMHMHGSANDP